jgi:hypothetical protein
MQQHIVPVSGDRFQPALLDIVECGAQTDGISDILPVPASNRAGGVWYTVCSNVTSRIMLPPPCQGGDSASTSVRP